MRIDVRERLIYGHLSGGHAVDRGMEPVVGAQQQPIALAIAPKRDAAMHEPKVARTPGLPAGRIEHPQ